MRYTPQELALRIDRIEATLQANRVFTLKDLEHHLDEILIVDATAQKEFIEAAHARSNFGTIATRLSYLVTGGYGIVINLVFNRSLEYTNLLVKCTAPIANYKLSSIDPYGNGIHQHLLETTTLEGGLSELRRLRAELGARGASAP